MLWFFAHMDSKMRLKKNQAKGDWRDMDISDIRDHLMMEMDELDWELNAGDQDFEKVIKEAADVANLAMMVADKARTLRPSADKARSLRSAMKMRSTGTEKNSSGTAG